MFEIDDCDHNYHLFLLSVIFSSNCFRDSQLPASVDWFDWNTGFHVLPIWSQLIVGNSLLVGRLLLYSCYALWFGLWVCPYAIRFESCFALVMLGAFCHSFVVSVIVEPKFPTMKRVYSLLCFLLSSLPSFQPWEEFNPLCFFRSPLSRFLDGNPSLI